MAKSSNANTFDVVKVGKPYRDAEGNFLGYTEQEIAREIWEQQQSLPEEERNPHFRGMKPLEEVKDRLLTPKTMPLMQSPQPRNPAEELITVVSDLQSRLSALEDENRQLKGAGGELT